MKTPIEWYRELYQRSGGATEADIAAIQADALGDLRDRFACAALTGLLIKVDALSLAHDAEYASGKWKLNVYTDLAYTLADAMMARRAQQTGALAPAPKP